MIGISEGQDIIVSSVQPSHHHCHVIGLRAAIYKIGYLHKYRYQVLVRGFDIRLLRYCSQQSHLTDISDEERSQSQSQAHTYHWVDFRILEREHIISMVYLQVSWKPVSELFGKLRNLIVEVNGGCMLQQRILLVHCLHDFVVTVPHAHCHYSSKTLHG